MNWQELCDNPYLKDLPFKIELNEWGQIVMTPASNKHGFYQMQMGILLNQHMSEGEVISECSIETESGVKVADIAWLSSYFLEKYDYETPYPQAPEICVEIMSPSNSMRQMQEKMKLYFNKGAEEVWLCNESGKIYFYNVSGMIHHSLLVPHFPENINK